jgi:sugar phosphate isomerase/epimerase
MVSLGVCCTASQAALAAAGGADYVELMVVDTLVPTEDDDAWAARRDALLALPAPVETFNVFMTAHRLTGQDVDFDTLRTYVDRALQRASEIGGKVIVIGSGTARRIPEGFPPTEAERQFLRLLGLCADAYDRTGVQVAIEPLNRGESNMILSVDDGARLARLVARPGVRALADTYHMEKEGEPLSAITAAADVLAHVHTADTDRVPPGQGTFDHVALFRTLNEIGYHGRLSIECRWSDFASEVGPALAHLRGARDVAAAG